VIFKLKNGNINFHYVLSDYHFIIAPAGTQDREWDNCIGTGAFILKTFEPGVRIFAVRNPNYWKEGRGHFDEMDLLVIRDVNTRTNALKTDRVDFMDDVDVRTVHLLEKEKNLQIMTETSGFHHTLAMRFDTKPYDNIDVRLAMKYAINREQIVKNIIKGYGKLGNDHPIGPNLPFHASELPQRTYDPDKARYHMKKAGLEGHTFKLGTMPSKGMADVAVLFKEHAAQAGIKIEIEQKPADGYWSNVWMKDPFITTFWNGRPSEDLMFTVAWSEESSWNETYWKNEKFSKLLVAARVERDEGKRRDMYVEMQGICRDEAANVVYMFTNQVMAANKKLKYKNLAGNYSCDGFRGAERWWFES
jgi:peptide/nickel transport system substrate-binding protein